MKMTMVYHIPPIPPDVPPGGLTVAHEVFSNLESDDLESLVDILRDPHRDFQLLYDDEVHRIESVPMPSGAEIWLVIAVTRDAALVILPVEPQEEFVQSMQKCELN
jgi:hypothetical protein